MSAAVADMWPPTHGGHVALRPTPGPLVTCTSPTRRRPSSLREHNRQEIADFGESDADRLDAAKSKLLLWLLWNTFRTRADGARKFMGIVAQLAATGFVNPAHAVDPTGLQQDLAGLLGTIWPAAAAGQTAAAAAAAAATSESLALIATAAGPTMTPEWAPLGSPADAAGVLVGPESRFSSSFAVLGRLGRGGFGTTAKVRSRHDGQQYAVKTVRGVVPLARLAAAGETLDGYVRRRWLHEAATIAVRHCLCLVFPLSSWLRQCLSLHFSTGAHPPERRAVLQRLVRGGLADRRAAGRQCGRDAAAGP